MVIPTPTFSVDLTLCSAFAELLPPLCRKGREGSAGAVVIQIPVAVGPQLAHPYAGMPLVTGTPFVTSVGELHPMLQALTRRLS